MNASTTETLPITVSPEVRENPHIITGIAQKAFQLANYDMSPDNPVDNALRLGLIKIETSTLDAAINE